MACQRKKKQGYLTTEDWEKVLWTNESRLEIFGSTVKHRGESVIHYKGLFFWFQGWGPV